MRTKLDNTEFIRMERKQNTELSHEAAPFCDLLDPRENFESSDWLPSGVQSFFWTLQICGVNKLDFLLLSEIKVEKIC